MPVPRTAHQLSGWWRLLSGYLPVRKTSHTRNRGCPKQASYQIDTSGRAHRTCTSRTHPPAWMVDVAGAVAVSVRTPTAPPTEPPLVRVIEPPAAGHVVPSSSVITSVVRSPRPVRVIISPTTAASTELGVNESPLPSACPVKWRASEKQWCSVVSGKRSDGRNCPRTSSQLAGRHIAGGASAIELDAVRLRRGGMLSYA